MTSPTLTDARARAVAAQEAVQAAQKEMAEAFKTALVEGLAPIFERYPFLGEISWTQYTPFFNDGDPCVFSSNLADAALNSVVDVENGEGEAAYENGPDFTSKADKEMYAGHDQETHRGIYINNPDFDPEYEACETEVREFLSALAGNETRSYGVDIPSATDAALQQAFGDHAQILVNRDGEVIVDEYSHD